MNKVILIGHLGGDPEVKIIGNGGISVANFSVATNDGYKDKNGDWVDKTEWHSCVAWRGQAEYIGKYANKGMRVSVVGKLETKKWTDDSGTDRYKTEIVCHEFNIEQKREETAHVGGSSYSEGRVSTPTSKVEEEVDDIDDLPF